ncbi:MAG: hypothetical protein A2001_19275 [Treponema sp. GWC1_61_84]|nr:MAG: hypothetical protein A2001_19275 [Treponema sp. GWC1_61_84]
MAGIIEIQNPLPAANPRKVRLVLDNAAGVRKTIARIMRMRFRGELDSLCFRDLIYAANTMLGYDRLEADLKIEERLNALEEAMNQEPGALDPEPGVPIPTPSVPARKPWK